MIDDIKSHVRSAGISLLDGTDEFIYFNLTTLEGEDYCVQMSKNGFLLADTSYDSSKMESGLYFETPYALLDTISPMYRESFANKLIDSLNSMKGNLDNDVQ